MKAKNLEWGLLVGIFWLGSALDNEPGEGEWQKLHHWWHGASQARSWPLAKAEGAAKNCRRLFDLCQTTAAHVSGFVHRHTRWEEREGEQGERSCY